MPYQPTRLPYGISYCRPGANTTLSTATQYVLQNSSSTLFATPNVDYGTYFVANVSGLITNFVGNGRELGRVLYIKCETGGVVVLQNSAGGIIFNNIVGATSNNQVITVSSTAGNLTMLNGEVLEFINDGVSWCMVGDRFVISTQV